MFKTEVKGLKELNSRIAELKTEMQVQIAKGATASAASLLKKRVRENIKTAGIHTESGTLDRAVYTAYAKDLSSHFEKHTVVGVRQGKKYRRSKRDAYYWWWLEFGTSKMKARPFMVPAFDHSIPDMLTRITDYIAKRLKKYGV